MLNIINAGNIEGRAYLNAEDLADLTLNEFDFIVIKSEYEDWAGVQILSSDEVDPGFIAVDGAVLESSNLNDGDEIEIFSNPKNCLFNFLSFQRFYSKFYSL